MRGGGNRTPGKLALLFDPCQVHKPQQSFPLTTLSFVAPGTESAPNPLVFSSLNQTPGHCTPHSKGHLSRSMSVFLKTPFTTLEMRGSTSFYSPKPTTLTTLSKKKTFYLIFIFCHCRIPRFLLYRREMGNRAALTQSLSRSCISGMTLHLGL